MALTLHADHGLNASTFASMVIASTMADIYSSVIGGIGALSGPLHGGANEDVMEMLEEIDASGTDPVEWAKAAREEGRRIPGYGHRVYRVKDPRAEILEQRLRDLSAANGDTKWLDYTTAIEEYLADQGLLEEGIAPNVDFYSGSVYDHLGIPTDMYTPIFAMARAGGWIAHVLEYQTDNRLIRPRARYTGPTDVEFVPIDER
jgi:citrate synthase